jgi:hypothetical protein
VTEKELYSLLCTVISNGLQGVGAYAGVDCRQADQPSKQGRPTGPAVLLSNQPQRRYGFVRRDDRWDSLASIMVHTETQIMETTFQAGALFEQDPKAADAATSPTAGDLLNYVARILQSDAGRAALIAGGADIERITDIRTPYFKNDRENFEASPSFDFTLIHTFVDVSSVPVVSKFTPAVVAT